MINLIKNRRSVRLFDQDKEVETEKIHQILECGHLSPSAKNLQPWYFVVITNKKLIKKIVTLPLLNKPEGKNILDDKDERFKANLPKVMIAVFFEKSKSVMADEKYYKEANIPEEKLLNRLSYSDIISIGASIQNMHLACEGLGLGSCITGEFLDVEDNIGDEIYELLSVDKEKYLIMGGIRFGYPVKEAYKFFERDPLEKHFHEIK